VMNGTRPLTKKTTGRPLVGRPAPGRRGRWDRSRPSSVRAPAWRPLVLRPVSSRTGATGAAAVGARPPAGFGFVGVRAGSASGARGAQVAMGLRVAGGPPEALPREREDVSQAGIRSYLVCLVAAFALAGLLVWASGTGDFLGYRVDELKTAIATLQGENERLSFELSGYQSVARIEREATGRLGLVRPEYVRISAGDVGQGGAAEAVPQALARIIRLTPDGAAGESGDAVAVESETRRGPLGTLWERFYRWLTGAAQAEASDWR